MKNIIILTGKPTVPDQPFSSDSIYRTPYEHLSTTAAQSGLALYRASYQWYDHEQKMFSTAWSFTNGQWILSHNIRPDVIFNKAVWHPHTRIVLEQLKTFTPIINDLEFSTILSNKLYTSLILAHHSKKHYKVYNEKELLAITQKIPTKKIVLKKSHGSGGKYVEVLTADAVVKHQLTYPILVQEFIDSRKGIPGCITGPHDLRLVFIENELIYTYARVPAQGSDLANISQGGTIIPMSNSDVPSSLLPIVHDIQDIFDIFRYKVYAIDVMFDEYGTPWVIELNDKPGLFFSDEQKDAQEKMFSRLIALFDKAQK